MRITWFAISLIITLLIATPIQCGDLIDLPEPTHRGISVEEALMKRRSIRSYSQDSLSLSQLSMLLFAAQGITGKSGERKLRTAPSAGATYPIEVYVLINRVKGMRQGIYHYIPEGHKLEALKVGDFGSDLKNACLGQSMPEEAPISIILTSVAKRTTRVYGEERGMRYIYMEAGHICQNICLEATSLGLGSVPIGAFYDDAVTNLIGVEKNRESAIYVVCVGYPRGKE